MLGKLSSFVGKRASWNVYLAVLVSSFSSVNSRWKEKYMCIGVRLMELLCILEGRAISGKS